MEEGATVNIRRLPVYSAVAAADTTPVPVPNAQGPSHRCKSKWLAVQTDSTRRVFLRDFSSLLSLDLDIW